jgi:hypothetical protein
MDAHAAAARIDMIGIVQQLERALADELDYRIEARNAPFPANLAEFPRIPFRESSRRIRRSECSRPNAFADRSSIPISPLTRLEHDFHPVAVELTRAYLKQITIDGHFPRRSASRECVRRLADSRIRRRHRK